MPTETGYAAVSPTPRHASDLLSVVREVGRYRPCRPRVLLSRCSRSASGSPRAGQSRLVVTRLVPWTASTSPWPVSMNPSLPRTRREAVFQSQTAAETRSYPDDRAQVEDRPCGLRRIALTPGPTQHLEGQLGLPVRSPAAVDQPAVSDHLTSGLPLDRQQPGRRRLVGPDPLFDVRDRGVSFRVDAAVLRHPRITLCPQLTLDGSLGHLPRPEEQPIRLEHHLPSCTRHDATLATDHALVPSTARPTIR